MKKYKLSLYVVLPVIFALIIHFFFWYVNSFKPLVEWEIGARIISVLLMVFAIIIGIIIAGQINDGKDKS